MECRDTNDRVGAIRFSGGCAISPVFLVSMVASMCKGGFRIPIAGTYSICHGRYVFPHVTTSISIFGDFMHLVCSTGLVPTRD